ncbi:Unconventional myosin-Id [Dissostichus eleginoides]|uniref:Unconventional myosin-Id n=1 Tax=Dissostichus eleginoides TaxID=100907 RepID=A0AAD9BCI8_DISEL|nr:Unconventional myosin-Id [Dissostichus eleginoides]
MLPSTASSAFLKGIARNYGSQEVNHGQNSDVGEKRKLQVNITSPIQCSMNGRKCTVIVEPKINQSQPDFTKSRSGYILAVPGN